MPVKNKIAVFCAVAACMLASVGIILSHIVMKHTDASHQWIGMAILVGMVTIQVVLLTIAVASFKRKS